MDQKKVYHLFLATLEKVFFDDDVEYLIAPGSLGYFGVLINHAPIISTLRPGKLTITDKNKKKRTFAISGGFFEMSNNKATLLADAIEEPSEIDIKRSEKRMNDIQKKIDNRAEDEDITEIKKALLRAQNRVKIAKDL
jgi:F-type H+-transporting ATPase subunit epsilon